MGAGVAELMDRLAAVNVQLDTAPHNAELLLVQKAALEAALKAAQAKKSEDAAAAGAYGLLSSFTRARPCCFSTRLPHAPRPASHTHTLIDASPRPPFYAAAASNAARGIITTTPQDKRDANARLAAANVAIQRENVVNMAYNADLRQQGITEGFRPMRPALCVPPPPRRLGACKTFFIFYRTPLRCVPLLICIG